MKLIFKHIGRNLLENKVRSIILIMSIAVISAVLYFGLLLRDGIGTKYENMVRAFYGDFDIRISKDDRSCFNDISMKTGAVKTMKTTEITLPVNGTEVSYVYLIGIDFNEAKESGFLDNGIMACTGQNAAVISKADSERYGLFTGQTVNVSVDGDENIPITITEIGENKGYLSSNIKCCKIVVDIDTVKKINRLFENGNYLYMDFEDSCIDKSFAELEEEYPSYSVVKLFDNRSVNATVDFLYLLFYIFFAVLLFIMFLVIYDTTSETLKDRVESFAVFQCCGAEKSYLVFVFVTENVLTGIVGSTLGILFSVLTCDSLFSLFFNATVEVEKRGPLVDFRAVALTYLIVIIMDILMLGPALFRIKKTDIIERIREKDVYTTGTIIIEGLLGLMLCGISIIWVVSVEELFAVSAAVGIIMLTVGGCVIAVPFSIIFHCLIGKLYEKTEHHKAQLAIKNLRNSTLSLKNIRTFIVLIAVSAVFFWSGKLFHIYVSSEKEEILSDYVISGMSVNECKYHDVLGQEGISDYGMMFCAVQALGGEKKAPLMCIAVSGTAGIETFYGVLKSLDSIPSEGEVLADEEFLEKYGLVTGDKLTVAFSNGDERDFVIVGQCSLRSVSQGMPSLLMNFEDYRKSIVDIPAYIFLNTEENFNIENFKKNFSDALAVIMDTEEFIADKGKYWRQLESFGIYMLAGGILLALFGIAVNKVVMLNQRRDEFSIYLSTCMDKKQLTRLLADEELISGIMELLLSVILFYGESLFVGRAFGSTGTGFGDFAEIALMIVGMTVFIKGLMILYVKSFINHFRIWDTYGRTDK